MYFKYKYHIYFVKYIDKHIYIHVYTIDQTNLVS